MKIFLTGMPSSGKSTLAQGLAQFLGLPFVDLDTFIEQQEGLTVPQIFAQKGQDYFRQAERQALHAATGQQAQFVMATGGGAPCFFDNMAFMNGQGITIYLDVPVAELAARLSSSQMADRPLVQALDANHLEEELYQKLKGREAWYHQAQIAVWGKETQVASIVPLLPGHMPHVAKAVQKTTAP